MPVATDVAHHVQPAALLAPTDYPAACRKVAGLVDGLTTDVMSFYFFDKILITICQEGRLAQWMQVPLSSTSPSRTDHFLPSSSTDESLLPMPHLTASILLGNSTPEREIVGQLFAVQIASAISLKNPVEQRPVVVGLGLKKADISREQFFDILLLVTQCL